MELHHRPARVLENLGPIRVVFDRDDLDCARQVAIRKVDLVNVDSPGGSPRNRDVRLRRLVAGKLADHAVRRILERYYRKNGKRWAVEEYDEVRTDGFRDADPWDLRCFDDTGRSLLVEVRSSFVHRLNSAYRLQNNHRQSLLGPYATASKPGEQPKDLFWQVAFFNVPADEGAGAPNPPFFGDHRDRHVSATVMGGGERQLFERIGTTQSLVEGAAYRVISPMSAGRTVGQMLRLSCADALSS